MEPDGSSSLFSFVVDQGVVELYEVVNFTHIRGYISSSRLKLFEYQRAQWVRVRGGLRPDQLNPHEFVRQRETAL